MVRFTPLSPYHSSLTPYRFPTQSIGGAEFVADERPLCTPCTGTSTGCSSTQYCVNVNNMVTPGCCREKQAAGGFCVPRRAGVDCTSGRCNNVIPAVSIFGIPIGIQNLNQWVGNCA